MRSVKEYRMLEMAGQLGLTAGGAYVLAAVQTKLYGAYLTVTAGIVWTAFAALVIFWSLYQQHRQRVENAAQRREARR